MEVEMVHLDNEQRVKKIIKLINDELHSGFTYSYTMGNLEGYILENVEEYPTKELLKARMKEFFNKGGDYEMLYLHILKLFSLCYGLTEEHLEEIKKNT